MTNLTDRLAAIRALAEKLDGGLPCAWCDIPAVGLARHNDGLLNPSCGEDGHGFDWQAAVSPRTIAEALTSYPTMATALTAVLDRIDQAEDERRVAQEGSPTALIAYPVVDVGDLRDAITDALEVQG